MVDIVDLANDFSDMALQQAINNRKQYSGKSQQYCEYCGDEIPKQRREAVKGVRYCILCQEEIERRR